MSAAATLVAALKSAVLHPIVAVLTVVVSVKDKSAALNVAALVKAKSVALNAAALVKVKSAAQMHNQSRITLALKKSQTIMMITETMTANG